MKDEDKTKGQLMKKLEQLRRRVTEMEAIEVKHMASKAALKLAEAEKQTILDSLVEHVVYHDMEMRVLWANRAACDSIGMTHEEVVGGHCYELWAKRSEACEDCPVQLARQTGQPQAVEKTTPDGRSWYIQGSPVRDSNGDIVGMVELTLDITERKRAEEGLRQVHDELENRVEKRTAELVRANEQLRQEIRERMQAEEELGRYKLIVSAVHDPMSFIDSNYIYRTVNDAYTEVFNRPREEIIGRSVAEMFGTEIFEKQIKSYLARCLNGEEVHYRDWLDFPDGKRRCMLISYYPFFENDKSVSALVVKAHDMTDLELAQEALHKSERTLNAILAASPMGIGLVRNRILGWTNKAMHRMWGYEEGSLLGQSTEILYPDAEEYERVGRDFYSEIEKWGIGQVETRWLTKDGRVIDCYLQGSPLDSSDISKGVIVAAMDITERKRMEEVLRESEKFTSSLLNNSPNAILVINPDTSIRYTNSAFERLTGFFSSEILGSKPPYPWWPEETSETITVDFDEAIQKGVNRFEEVFQKKNGERFWVEITGIPVRKNGRFDYYLSNWVDITKRKWAQENISKLSQELIQVQEVERQRLASDLHDHVAQDLASLRINLDALYADQTDTPGERRQRIFELSKLTQHSILAIRDMAYGLHPASLKEFGIAHTVQQFCEEFAGKNSLDVDLFSVGMDELELDFDTEITLYRLIQEGLTNIWKHADASHVNVRLSATVSHIMLHIEDNGNGFEVNKRLAAALDEKRMGIWGMEQRVAFLNGEMKIESGLAHGTKILIKVPHMDKTNG